MMLKSKKATTREAKQKIRGLMGAKNSTDIMVDVVQHRETLPIPLKYVDVIRESQTSRNKASGRESMIFGPKRRVSILLRSGLGLQDSRSYVQGFLKDASGKMEDLRKSRRLPDQTAYGLKLG